MQEPVDIWRPALIAGAIFGFVSGVPIVGALNCACCSLIVGAGALAAFMMVRASGHPLSYGRAALAGMVSGLIAAPVESVSSLVFTTLILGRTPAQQMEAAFDQVSQYAPNADEAFRLINSIPAAIWILLSTFILMILFAPFGALGGVIGRALFERRAAPPPAPVTGAAPTGGAIDP